MPGMVTNVKDAPKPETERPKATTRPKQAATKPAPERPPARPKAAARKRPAAPPREPALAQPPAPPKVLTPAEALQELVRRADAGSPSALAELRQFLDRNPEIWRTVGNVSSMAERAWTELVSAGSTLAAESIRRRLAALKGELAGDQATPLEGLLVDMIAVSWLAMSHAEAAAAQVGGSLQQARFRLRRAESAQRRLLAAMKMLTMLRALVPRGLLPLAVGVKPSGPEGERA